MSVAILKIVAFFIPFGLFWIFLEEFPTKVYKVHELVLPNVQDMIKVD